jgi:hypothetical protein
MAWNIEIEIYVALHDTACTLSRGGSGFGVSKFLVPLLEGISFPGRACHVRGREERGREKHHSLFSTRSSHLLKRAESKKHPSLLSPNTIANILSPRELLASLDLDPRPLPL